VAEQFHHGCEAPAAVKHFRLVGMPPLMRAIYGKGDRVADHVQVLAKLSKETCLGSSPYQQLFIGGQRIEEAEEAQAENRNRWALTDRTTVDASQRLRPLNASRMSVAPGAR
jgi:hypothetical protein